MLTKPNIFLSINHNLLRLHIVALDETQHINARGHSLCRDAMLCVYRNVDTTHHVNHLQGRAFNVTRDDDVPVVEECEGFCIC